MGLRARAGQEIPDRVSPGRPVRVHARGGPGNGYTDDVLPIGCRGGSGKDADRHYELRECARRKNNDHTRNILRSRIGRSELFEELRKRHNAIVHQDIPVHSISVCIHRNTVAEPSQGTDPLRWIFGHHGHRAGLDPVFQTRFAKGWQSDIAGSDRR